MTVSMDSPHFVEHDGKRHVFCSAACRTRFLGDPARYLSATHAEHDMQPARGPDASPPLDASARTIYTCPMHPEMRQDQAWQLPQVRNDA